MESINNKGENDIPISPIKREVIKQQILLNHESMSAYVNAINVCNTKANESDLIKKYYMMRFLVLNEQNKIFELLLQHVPKNLKCSYIISLLGKFYIIYIEDGKKYIENILQCEMEDIDRKIFDQTMEALELNIENKNKGVPLKRVK